MSIAPQISNFLYMYSRFLVMLLSDWTLQSYNFLSLRQYKSHIIIFILLPAHNTSMTTAGTQSQYAHVNIRRLRHRKTSVMAKKRCRNRHTTQQPCAVCCSDTLLYICICLSVRRRPSDKRHLTVSQSASFLHPQPAC